MRLALAQMNAVVGDLDGNRDKILASLAEARARRRRPRRLPGARGDRLSARGSPPPPGLRPRGARVARARSRRRPDDIVALVGTPWFDRDLANACAVCADGRVRAVYRKQFLPNYGVFDEHRYFARGTRARAPPVRGGVASGIDDLRGRLAAGPAGDRPRARRRAAHRRTSPRRRSTSARPRSARRCSSRALATRARSSPSATSSAARTSSSSTGTRSCSTTRGEVVARAPGLRRAPPRRRHRARRSPIGRRLRDVRRRELDRSRETPPRSRSSSSSARRRRRTSAAGAIAPFEPALEQMRLALDARPARLRREERVRRGRRRRLRRDRLGA